jgi:peptidoglycan/LPS O-acetylase OafA/YrhL
MAMLDKKIQYQPHLDGLRAVAVLMVLGFHAFPGALPAGFIGVDVFFVISGFLISTILEERFRASDASLATVLKSFYAGRVRRLFPGLIVVLAVCYLAGLVLLLPVDFKRFGADVAASVGFCLNLVLAGTTGYFNPDASTNPLLHLWSLGVEEQFYLVWPLVIWAAVRSRIRLLPLLLFFGASSYLWNATKSAAFAEAAFYLPQMRFWELLIGAITAVAYAWRKRAPRQLLGWLGFGLIGSGLILIPGGFESIDWPNAWSLLPTLGTACLILAGESAWINRRLLSQPVLVGIGLISYPLYLWHWPLLCFPPLFRGEENPPALKLVLLGLAVLLAWLTYRWFERPVRRSIRSGSSAAILGVLLLAIGGVGYFTYRENGLPARLPPLIRALTDSSYDYSKNWRPGTYFLMGEQDETNFKLDPNEISKTKATLYLWGDSHAAGLYPGYRSILGTRFNIVQRTTAGNPPLLNQDGTAHSNVERINRYIFASIKRDRPEVVVLAANWCACDWTRLRVTVAALKALAIEHIIVVGPVPQWIGSLPQELCSYSLSHGFTLPPVRMKFGVNPAPARIDRLMAAACVEWGVEYISPCRILGNADGFITRTGDTADTLMSFDYGHLTDAGSQYLVARFPPIPIRAVVAKAPASSR